MTAIRSQALSHSFAIKNIVLDIPLNITTSATLPFVVLMAIAVFVCCVAPDIVTWLPGALIK